MTKKSFAIQKIFLPWPIFVCSKLIQNTIYIPCSTLPLLISSLILLWKLIYPQLIDVLGSVQCVRGQPSLLRISDRWLCGQHHSQQQCPHLQGKQCLLHVCCVLGNYIHLINPPETHTIVMTKANLWGKQGQNTTFMSYANITLATKNYPSNATKIEHY